MLTQRQEKLLDFLIKEYIVTAEPVSSNNLKKICDLDVSAATIRNDLRALTKDGYINQPHTSAGRVPTQRAYKYFADKLALERANRLETFIVRQIRQAHEEMEREMQHMQEIMRALEQDNMFDILNILDKWHQNRI